MGHGRASLGSLRAQPARAALVGAALRASGRPLDPSTRGLMESRFGHDFSQVRVHVDASAATSARAVGALAYTVGRDVVFQTGQYRPDTDAGRRLLAHELTHVLQQRSAASGLALASLELDVEGSAGEREAETVAASFTSAGRLPVAGLSQTVGRLCLQRDEDDAPRQREPLGRRANAPLPYREAMDATTQGLYEEYQRNCEGVMVLERLERQEVTPIQRVQGLERRLRVIPHLFAAKHMLKEETDPIKHAQMDESFHGQVYGDFPKFPPGYILTNEEDETARAKCELSKARWELLMSVQHRRTPGSLLRR